MKKIKVMTDSNSTIYKEEGDRLGVSVVPMPFFIDGEEYLEGINLTQELFYEKLLSGAKVSTSQPSIGLISSMWDEILEEYDSIIYIPMTSGLSKSYETAKALSLSEEYDGKVFVVDNKRISVPQRESVMDAIRLVNEGYSEEAIVNILEDNGLKHDIFIMLDTLEYLKKGGRITPTAAALGGMLKLKPILLIKGGKLDSYRMRNRTLENGKNHMIDACNNCVCGYMYDIDNKYDNVECQIAYSGLDDTNAKMFAQEIRAKLGVEKVTIKPLSLSIACHTGPNAIGMAVVKKLPSDLRQYEMNSKKIEEVNFIEA